MANRYDDALICQGGACNVRRIARSLHERIEEVAIEGGTPSDDPAVRLIAHQLAFLLCIAAFDTDPNAYQNAVAVCQERAESSYPTITR
jgi:hypothetical protein